MKMKVFSVYDKVAGNFNRPFFKLTIAEAIRDCEMVFKLGQDMTVVHSPQDYDLYFVGAWDDVVGLFDKLEENQRVLTFLEIKKRVEEREDMSTVNKSEE